MFEPTSDVTVFFTREPVPRETVQLAVTLPTFRRPEHLIRTLESLLAQHTDKTLAIVVIENDADSLAGAMAAKHFLEDRSVTALVVVAHQRGNCHAYNAGWTAALAHYPALEAIAVIDDDELAAPGWLTGLVKVSADTGADLVGGPQVPKFESGAGAALIHHPVFSPAYRVTGAVPILYSSGNVLIRRSVLDAMPRPFLDPLFNFIGGGDSDFYRRCKTQGFCFAWAAEAEVIETVPLRRTERDWIRTRSLRNGAISAMLEHRARPDAIGRTKTVLKSLALLLASPWRGLSLWRRTGLASAAPYHLQVALGRLMAEAGIVGEQYRNPEKN
ncbi:glycosyl transferase family A [Xaviernesmea oryzae]|uniref:Glycosyl transferase family A n=1 Tax=Xaviernesmea oryzae TaxID=464029 RepID=A0A1Q9ARU6_9HYPH|nr:glycosyltransferase [Xaviernesmea oryzae]OLP58154.1 glycosyl transferase family A [Xaviernesmea oryzae]SEL80756.1 Glycosyltransferase, GT2 family [Xaviernesmea oryzae]